MYNRNSFVIAKIIDEDSAAPMNGLLIRPDCTVATDGHALLICTVPEAQPELLPMFPEDDRIEEAQWFTPFVLDKASALKLAKVMRKPDENEAREMAVVDVSTEEDGTATLAVNDDDRRVIVKAEKLGGTFPAYEMLIPERDQARFEISFSPGVLIPVLKAFEKFGSQVTLRIYGAMAGMRIDAEAGGQRMTALVMPLRMAESTAMEAEHQESAPVAEVDNGCVDCVNGIQLIEPGQHASGQKCTAAPESGTLAPSAVMGGTRTRQRNRRGGEPDTETVM